MKWEVGYNPPSREFRPLPDPPAGVWEPVLQLRSKSLGDATIRSASTDVSSEFNQTHLEPSLASPKLHPSTIRFGLNCVKFSPDGKLLATARSDGELSVYDIQNGKRTLYLPFAHATSINDIAWHPSSNYIYTASSDCALKLFSLHEAVSSFSTIDSGPSGMIQQFTYTTEVAGCKKAHEGGVLAVASPIHAWGGNAVYTGGQDELLRSWDARSLSSPYLELKVDDAPISSIEFSSDGRVCCTASFSGMVRLWQTYSMRIIQSLLANDGAGCSHAVFSLNDKYILCNSMSHEARIWSLSPSLLNEDEIYSKTLLNFSQAKKIGQDRLHSGTEGTERIASTVKSASSSSENCFTWNDFGHPYINLVPYRGIQESICAANKYLKKWCEHHPITQLQLVEQQFRTITTSDISTKLNHEFRYASYCDFWRDRALVPARDGCLHVYHALTGIHEHQLLKLQHPHSSVSCVNAHPNHNLGIIATGTGEPDGIATLWTFIPSKMWQSTGLDDLVSMES